MPDRPVRDTLAEALRLAQLGSTLWPEAGIRARTDWLEDADRLLITARSVGLEIRPCGDWPLHPGKGPDG